MRRSLRRLVLPTLLVAAALGTSACGSNEIKIPEDDPDREMAELFYQRCSGCHTFEVVGAEGSASNVGTREYKDGPSFDQRPEDAEDVLFAIRNGGFSSGPMPQNIVVGEDAERLADFVAKYSGQKAERPLDPTGGQPAGGEPPPGAEPPEETQ
jgi:mono/diheme cytochrome c family protein